MDYPLLTTRFQWLCITRTKNHPASCGDSLSFVRAVSHSRYKFEKGKVATRRTKSIAQRVFVGEVQSHSRTSGSDSEVKFVGTPRAASMISAVRKFISRGAHALDLCQVTMKNVKTKRRQRISSTSSVGVWCAVSPQIAIHLRRKIRCWFRRTAIFRCGIYVVIL